MTTKDEALQMALDALTCVDDGGYDPGHRCGHCDDYVDRNGHVRAAIRAALAQKDEAVVTTTTIEALEQEIYENTRLFVPTAVMQWMLSKYHTAPPKRQPLTDELRYALIKEHLGLDKRRDETVIDRRTGRWTDAARYFDLMDAAIETANGTGEQT